MLDGDEQQNGALERLYELVHDGRSDTVEFEQLDRMVYQQLLDTYGDVDDDASPARQAA